MRSIERRIQAVEGQLATDHSEQRRSEAAAGRIISRLTEQFPVTRTRTTDARRCFVEECAAMDPPFEELHSTLLLLAMECVQLDKDIEFSERDWTEAEVDRELRSRMRSSFAAIGPDGIWNRWCRASIA